MPAVTAHPALQSLPFGWFHHGEQILALLEQHRPVVTVELGTYFGASAIAMARVAKAWGGLVYCVDTWSLGNQKKRTIRRPLRIFSCAMNLVVAEVGPRMRLIPSRTEDAAKAWTGPLIDCLYVDADHTYEGCLSDLTLWTPHVRPGGLILGDDYDHSGYPGVKQAWDAFEATTGLTFHRVPTPDTDPPGMSLIYGWTPKE